jgi:hypothetical protein
MRGQMMDYALTLRPLLERAQRLFAKKEIVTKAGPGLEPLPMAKWPKRRAAGHRAPGGRAAR